MASRKKTPQVVAPQRKLKQSSLLVGLAKYERSGEAATSKSKIVDLEDSDPVSGIPRIVAQWSSHTFTTQYKFVDSQSMDPGDSKTLQQQTPRPLPCDQNGVGGSLKTPVPGRVKKGGTSSTSSLNTTSTPVGQQQGAKSKRSKVKRCKFNVQT